MRKRIQETQFFLSLDKIQQKIYSRTEQVREIEYNYNLAKNLGETRWLEIKTPARIILQIVKELIQSDNNGTN